ncbi:hypothetical protein [Sporosarcina ureae]|uniref:hypothetical protein n=1 Tax=Sporosarcina ureae TaxID=1571 RepID=UPI000A17B6B3|nr:hypothetical protein [Sporosarcina ureae]ARK22368.1 hypothetical protein SporoP32a_13000 [Sporosarcina ureae]
MAVKVSFLLWQSFLCGVGVLLDVTDRLDRCSSLAWSLKVVRVMLWTRAGTWGIASSHEPTSGGAASCLMATAYPAVVPALLSGNQVRLLFIEDENQ